MAPEVSPTDGNRTVSVKDIMSDVTTNEQEASVRFESDELADNLHAMKKALGVQNERKSYSASHQRKAKKARRVARKSRKKNRR